MRIKNEGQNTDYLAGREQALDMPIYGGYVFISLSSDLNGDEMEMVTEESDDGYYSADSLATPSDWDEEDDPAVYSFVDRISGDYVHHANLGDLNGDEDIDYSADALSLPSDWDDEDAEDDGYHSEYHNDGYDSDDESEFDEFEASRANYDADLTSEDEYGADNGGSLFEIYNELVSSDDDRDSWDGLPSEWDHEDDNDESPEPLINDNAISSNATPGVYIYIANSRYVDGNNRHSDGGSSLPSDWEEPENVNGDEEWNGNDDPELADDQEVEIFMDDNDSSCSDEYDEDSYGGLPSDGGW